MSTTVQSRMGFVLAGGKSTRMGSDKGFLEFEGRTLLERALSVAHTVCGQVAIVGDPSKFAKFGPVVADVFAGCGPIGGIHAALRHSSAELNLIVAVDMPFVTTNLLEFLFTTAEKHTNMVTVARTADGIQPLCAIYRRDFARCAADALVARRYKIADAFAGAAIRIIGEEELATAGFTKRDFFNINTPQDRCEAEGGSL